MRPFLLAMFAVTCLAGTETLPPPVLTIAVPDAARWQERLAKSPYGRIAQLPAVVKLGDAMAAAPGADPLIMAMVKQVQEVRCEVRMQPRLAADREAEDPFQVQLALRMPPGHDPKAPDGLVARRDGDWLLMGSTATQAVPTLPPAAGDADLTMVVDLTAVPLALKAADGEKVRRILGILGLGRIVFTVTTNADGTSETTIVHGSRLPLKAVDAAALAGLPEKPTTLMAAGIDGKALVRMVKEVAAAVDGADALAKADALVRGRLGAGLEDLLGSLDGTVVLAATPGVPFPCLTLSLPASPAIDGLVAKLLELGQPGEGASLAGQAAAQAVVIPLPGRMPVVPVLRRSSTRWLISTDMGLVESLSATAAQPFPVASLWPDAAGAVGLAWTDTRAQVQTIAGILPMMQAGIPDQQLRKLISQVQAAAYAVAPLLPPSAIVARTGAEGLRVEGRNSAVSHLMPVSILAGMMLPAITMVREKARQTTAASNMRQICMTAMAGSIDHDGAWPKDLDEIVKLSGGDLTAAMLSSPGRPEIARPFLYVRPARDPKASQPVLVQDPACNRGKGSMVCYGDGHVQYVKGTALWIEAQRLAVLPKAQKEGIESGDWIGQDGKPTGQAKPGDF